MPRIPKTERLLLAKEAGLLAERTRIEGELRLLAELRKELAATAKRPSRANKPRTTAPANDGVATTA